MTCADAWADPDVLVGRGYPPAWHAALNALTLLDECAVPDGAQRSGTAAVH